MDKLALGTIAIALLSAPLAAAETYSGSILVGHLGTEYHPGVTEIVDACTPDGAAEGVDGVWFDISGDDGTTFALTVDATLDADVYFYDAGCNWIEDYVGVQGTMGEPESGDIPANAAFAVVNGALGTGSFTLSIA